MTEPVAGRERYVWPAELDLVGWLAGLELRARWGGWGGEPFTAASKQRVSVYKRCGEHRNGSRRPTCPSKLVDGRPLAESHFNRNEVELSLN